MNAAALEIDECEPLALLEQRRPRYPDVRVHLLAFDGNPLMVLGRAVLALKHAGCGPDEVQQFIEEAAGRGVGHLVRVCCDWFEIR